MMASSPSLIQLPESKQSLNLSGMCTTRVIRFGVEVLRPGEMVVPEVDEVSVRKHEAGRAAGNYLIPTVENALFMPRTDCPLRYVKNLGGLLRRKERK